MLSPELLRPLSRPVVWAARLLPLAPLAVMVRPILYQAPRLQTYAGDVLGLGATLCLLTCLAVSPAAKLVRIRSAAEWRRWTGLCMFWIGLAGVVVAVLGGPVAAAGMRLSGSVQAWTGTTIVVALIPLALTSNRWSQKTLGTYWKTWQRRLTWAAWAVVAMHVLTLAAWRVEASFFMASGPLLLARAPAVRRDLGKWKTSGFADSARWLLTGAVIGVFACGLGYLLVAEVVASVTAARLT